MKEYWYKDIDEYLEMADTHDNPKTTKMFEILDVEEQDMRLFRAITHLRTYLIGFQKKVSVTELPDLSVKCKSHNHKEGIILEVGRLT